MSAYVKVKGSIVLVLSEAEATALQEVVHAGLDRQPSQPRNGMTVEAELRAIRALEIALQPGSRNGQEIT